MGLREIPAVDYHNDLIDDQRPSLSKSIIHLLCERSPAHAFTAHPRLNPNFARLEEAKYDLGTAAHQLFLEGDGGVEVVYADDWRTKAAKEAAEAARSDGRIPMLSKHWDECQAMVVAVRSQLEAFDVNPPLFTEGMAERTMVWEEHGVLCRARLDWLRDDGAAVDDLKTTRASANPEHWSRTMFNIGADIQVAFYMRGLAAVEGAAVAGMADFRFVVAETTPPYAISVVSLAPDALALADKKIDWAMRLWATCLRNGQWPAYPARVAYAEAPPWLEASWLAKELREVAA